MRYAQIRKMDISNGYGFGIALFVQGCHFHCKNCFNKTTWDFNKGELWTSEKEKKIIEMCSSPMISRLSLLGGEPLALENRKDINNLIINFRQNFKNDKKIWVWTGYTFEELTQISDSSIRNILKNIDYLIDGRFIEEKKNLNLLFRGSSNQRIINMKETLNSNSIVLLGENKDE